MSEVRILDPMSIEVFRTRVLFGTSNFIEEKEYPNRINLAMHLVDAAANLAILEAQEAMKQGSFPEAIDYNIPSFEGGEEVEILEWYRQKVQELSKQLWECKVQGDRMNLTLQLSAVAASLVNIEKCFAPQQPENSNKWKL